MAAHAAYPEKTITITVPTAPGGAVDVVARIMGEQISTILQQAVVVSNKPGAGGAIGTQAAKREQPDGYNILFTANSNQLIVPWVYKKPGFDPVQDFEPIAAIGTVPNVLCVHPSFPATNFKEFLAEIKANPEKYPYASAGNGTLNHLLGEMLKERAGIKLQHIAYKGVGPAMTDVIGGQVPMLFASLPSAVQSIKAGQIRAIAVSSATRTSLLPDVPAIAEQFTGFSGDLWVAFYAPKGTPNAVIATLNTAVKKAMASPALQQRFKDLGITPLNDGPEQLARRQQQELLQWKDIVRTSGATVD
jgi:tripartite-type tricarboxylate transporter receptor subunit TctC